MDRKQTSIRLPPDMLESLRGIAKRTGTGERITINDLLVEGIEMVLAREGVGNRRLSVKAVKSDL